MPTGCTLSLMLGGIIAQGLGWEYIFYAFGGCGLAWSLAWCLFMHGSPSANPRICEEERAFIGGGRRRRRDNEEPKQPPPPLPLPPLKSILTSAPVLALCVALACNNWSYSVFLNNIPTYLHDVQGLPLDEVKEFRLGLMYYRCCIFAYSDTVVGSRAKCHCKQMCAYIDTFWECGI